MNHYLTQDIQRINDLMQYGLTNQDVITCIRDGCII